ncbi:MAG: hypothetical protein ACK46X_08955 [Candidatus Sericytochromatia bacterium]
MIQYHFDREGGAVCHNANGLTFYLQGQPPARPAVPPTPPRPAALPVTKRPSWLPAIARGASRPLGR